MLLKTLFNTVLIMLFIFLVQPWDLNDEIQDHRITVDGVIHLAYNSEGVLVPAKCQPSIANNNKIAWISLWGRKQNHMLYGI